MIKTPLSTAIGGVGMYTKNSLIIGGGKIEPPFDPASLFENGEQGFWLDPSDLSTMFQDAAGTVPVTDIGQTVGLIINKSPMSIESNVEVPAFSTWRKSSLVTEVTDNSFTVTGAGGIALPTALLKVGLNHEVIVEYTSDVLVSIELYDSSGVSALNFIVSSSSGKLVGRFRSITGGIYLRASAASTITIKSITIKETFKGELVQPDSAKQPMLVRHGAWKGDGVDDFMYLASVLQMTEYTVVSRTYVPKASAKNNILVATGVGSYPYRSKDKVVIQGTDLGREAVINELDTVALTYVNGITRIHTSVDDKSYAVPTSWLSGAMPVHIGIFSPTGSSKSSAEYGDILIINRQLNDSEVSNLFKFMESKWPTI